MHPHALVRCKMYGHATGKRMVIRTGIHTTLTFFYDVPYVRTYVCTCFGYLCVLANNHLLVCMYVCAYITITIVFIDYLLFEAFGAFHLVVVYTSMPCLLFVCACSTHGLLKKSTTLL